MPIRQPHSVYDLEFDALAEALGSARDAARVFEALYRERRPVPRELLVRLAPAVPSGLRSVSRQQGSMSTKHLFELAEEGGRDSAAIESVRITRRTGATACVSSQAGCAVRCAFCASGAQGLARDLTAGEIVEQVIALGAGVNRVVYMGVGEPLHNLDAVLTSMRILRDRRGLALPTSAMTLSTVGDPAGLARLREVHMRLNLTISLHATRDEVRHRLMPGTARHGVEDVVGAAQAWSRRHRRPVTYAYLVLPGVNDSRADARRLARWFAHGDGRVNLMRCNPGVSGAAMPVAADRDLHRMLEALRSRGVEAGVRDTQGLDVQAACGQLRLRRQTRGGGR